MIIEAKIFLILFGTEKESCPLPGCINIHFEMTTQGSIITDGTRDCVIEFTKWNLRCNSIELYVRPCDAENCYHPRDYEIWLEKCRTDRTVNKVNQALSNRIKK